ncbi:unnamed protein product [Alternaria alternata]
MASIRAFTRLATQRTAVRPAVFSRGFASVNDVHARDPISKTAEKIAPDASRSPIPESKTSTIQEPEPSKDAKTKTFHIYRWNPDEPTSKPKMQSYTLDLNKTRTDDAGCAHQDQERGGPDPDFQAELSRGHLWKLCHEHRRSQHPGMPLNLAIYPLPHMYVVKDLVPDMTLFYKQYRSVKPYLQRTTAAPDGREFRQSKEDRKKLDGLYECILCACCSTSCPSYWWNQEEYLGPAVLLQSYRWIADSRDEKKAERQDALNNSMSLYRCHTILNCSRTCPKGLNPALAIAEIKKSMAFT